MRLELGGVGTLSSSLMLSDRRVSAKLKANDDRLFVCLLALIPPGCARARRASFAEGRPRLPPKIHFAWMAQRG
jgi:hypothetical protein